MTDNRRAVRLRTLKGGSILFKAGLTVDCVIRNLSKKGGHLVVETEFGIPDEFVLLIKPELIKRECRVAWRKPDRVGVQFV
jgi:hypothetical protein